MSVKNTRKENIKRMIEFNKFIKTINKKVDEWILHIHFTFTRHGYLFYNRDNEFSLQYNYDEDHNEDEDDFVEPIIFRNEDDWFTNEFMVYFREVMYENLRERVPFMTVDEAKLYLPEFKAMLNDSTFKCDALNPTDISIEYFAHYVEQKLTFEYFKHLLIENKIYEEAFMIHKTLNYEYWEDEDDAVNNNCIVMWDDSNKIIDNVMENDYSYEKDRKQNLMWIKFVKDKFNWVQGQKLYLLQKSNTDGSFYIYKSRDNTDKYNDFYINEEGYVYRKYFDMVKYNETKNCDDIIWEYQQVDCMYNKLLSS